MPKHTILQEQTMKSGQISLSLTCYKSERHVSTEYLTEQDAALALLSRIKSQQNAFAPLREYVHALSKIFRWAYDVVIERPDKSMYITNIPLLGRESGTTLRRFQSEKDAAQYIFERCCGEKKENFVHTATYENVIGILKINFPEEAMKRIK